MTERSSDRTGQLARDPFTAPDTPFVPTVVHTEAVARLRDSIATGERSVDLRCAAGLGKTVVLRRVLNTARQDGLKVARVDHPIDGASMFAALSSGLGISIPSGTRREVAWKALCDAARLCRFQGLAIVLAVDDCQSLSAPGDRADLDRLAHLDLHRDSRITVVRVGLPPDDLEPDASQWRISIRLVALTRSETELYLRTKLHGARRDERLYTPRAITRLHALSRGVPRAIDRLASLALRVSVANGLTAITPELIDDLSPEFAAIEA